MGFVAVSWNIVRKQMIKEWNKGGRRNRAEVLQENQRYAKFL